jgi:(p)ppGpp synthase/HD superfamily hydrolase
MINFEEAVEIAYRYHKGQKDLDGKPVLLHPLAVALMGNNDTERIVGVLHDVIEDTDCSFTDLENLGVSKNVINTLELLTHTEDESYGKYLSRIITSGNIIALKVKINDLRHNISRNNEDTEQKKRIKAKHQKALKKIENFLTAYNLKK